MKNERIKSDKTELLYETDGMITEFEAVVTEYLHDPDSDRDYVILDRTAFFPEGGGQQSDTGEIITGDGKSIRVYDVQSVDGSVRHYIDGTLSENDKITGKIDAPIRFSRMQNHGAEHLLCGLIHSRFGYENVGFHMSDEGVTFDVDGPLTEEDIRNIERMANEAVFKNVPVTVSFPTAEEATHTEYRSKLDTFEDIRLVTIEGYDVCACCAPHVAFTGQLGVIKILYHMPHRGGTRLFMIAGMDAYNDYVYLHDANAAIMEILSAKRDKTAEFVRDFANRQMLLKEENGTLKSELTSAVAENIIEGIRGRGFTDHGPEVIWESRLDETGLRNLINECTGKYEGIVCAFSGNDNEGYRYIFAVCKNRAKTAGLKAFADDFNKACHGRGGGSDIMVFGSTSGTSGEIKAYFNERAEQKE